MILYIVGIACVGKTTIGKMLAKKIGYSFFDIDLEIQNFYQKPIERIQDECFTMNEYRAKASKVLDNLLSNNNDSVISGSPSGLKYSYYQVYKKHKTDKQLYSIVIKDSFENVLDRLTFFDKDSNPIIETMDDSKKKRYLNKIKEDYDFFKESYKRADVDIIIENIPLKKVPTLIINEIQNKLNCQLPIRGAANAG